MDIDTGSCDVGMIVTASTGGVAAGASATPKEVGGQRVDAVVAASPSPVSGAV